MDIFAGLYCWFRLWSSSLTLIVVPALEHASAPTTYFSVCRFIPTTLVRFMDIFDLTAASNLPLHISRDARMFRRAKERPARESDERFH